MDKPHIRVELVDGTNTWITVVPIDVDRVAVNQEHYAVERAVGEAFAGLLGNLIREREIVNEHLRPFRRYVNA